MALYVSAAAESSAVLFSGTAGQIRSINILGVGASMRWAYVFDGANASGALLAVVPVPSSGMGTLLNDSGGQHGRYNSSGVQSGRFTNGLFIGSSTSAATYTASGGGDFRINAEVV